MSADPRLDPVDLMDSADRVDPADPVAPLDLVAPAELVDSADRVAAAGREAVTERLTELGRAAVPGILPPEESSVVRSEVQHARGLLVLHDAEPRR